MSQIYSTLRTRKKNRLLISEIYFSNNTFFITVCQKDMVCVFSTVNAGKTELFSTAANVLYKIKKTSLALDYEFRQSNFKI